jgi:hypothetical protein
VPERRDLSARDPCNATLLQMLLEEVIGVLEQAPGTTTTVAATTTESETTAAEPGASAQTTVTGALAFVAAVLAGARVHCRR